MKNITKDATMFVLYYYILDRVFLKLFTSTF